MADGVIDGTREAAARAAATRIARESYGKLIAYLAATTRDVASAEDALGDAFAAALDDWPVKGAPDNPAGWLARVARRRLIDAARRRRGAGEAVEALRLIGEELAAATEEASVIPDRRLALMFACAHPAIEAGIRAPLMLQTILGLDAAAIGSAFLVAPSTMGQRLSRAKAKIRLAGVPFRIPDRDELPARLDAVLEAIYAAFAHGWGQAFGDDPTGRNLAEEAIWLARAVVSLAPDEPEALGLLAMMLYSDSRRDARRDGEGRYAPLSDQDIALWDFAKIDEAERLLRLAGARRRPGRFQFEAAIQSAHAARRLSGDTDWPAIALLYDGLLQLAPTLVVAINRAVAIANARSPDEGLRLLTVVEAEGGLAEFQSYWAAKADLSARVGRFDDARDAYDRAIGLEAGAAIRSFLIARKRSLPRSL